jgi:hypothetical protein
MSGMKIERKDLIWSTGLLLAAVGIVFFWLLILNSLQWVPMWFFEAWAMVLQTCVFALVGAGLGAPVKKKTTGAVIGLTVFLLVLLLIHLPSRGR